ncbi:YheC/YheD family protein [Ureibacillus aquaedulcis]|uniref:YheC/YheD family protein n=1 Tax=Ureibacillus aquaedulcis TaxID=3058421 RepID=A0ABT8GUE9_9BACL|nr:YheC/YheD family protein [Ureibacillus sp. BA0131]MDN4494971.1 YheC/YheD family protein [Ureibacillus sp. BA0131]
MNWIKVERSEVEGFEQSQNILYTSKGLANKLKSRTILKFGQKEIPISVKEMPSKQEGHKADFHHPDIIQLSEDTISELLIQTSSTYQLEYSETTIKIGPVVGFLLGEQHYYYHHRRLKELTDAMGIYEKVGGLFIAFRYCSIDWQEKCIFGHYYNDVTKRWEYGKLPIPTVVYRRGFNKRNNFVNEYKNEFQWKVFNDIRFDKWEMYCQLKDNEKLNPFLPVTELLTVDSLLGLFEKYPKVILKPKSLSRGRGITIITLKSPETFVIHDYRYYNDLTIAKAELEEYLQEGKYLDSEYIIQPFLNLANIEGSPWDIRVVMQKNGENQWICNGIECRLAPSGKMITNISNGGRALHLKEALELAFGEEVESDLISKDIHAISMEFCKMMDLTGYHFAEFGLDIALDTHQHYWFIEANVRPTFKGFKALDEQIYKQICYEPILYSTSIAGFSWGNNDDADE